MPGGIVALGKFDALHIGHRELAIQASRAGPPFLLSFVGMAKVLGWEPRYDIVFVCIKLVKEFLLFVCMGGMCDWLLHSSDNLKLLANWFNQKLISTKFMKIRKVFYVGIKPKTFTLPHLTLIT